MAKIEVTVKCYRCGGTGVPKAELAYPTEIECAYCDGTGYLYRFSIDDVLMNKLDDIYNDITDKCNDIMDKCNDIMDKLNEP